nr:hypothetical protein B11C_110021 [Bartonella sp. 1-1C]
MCSIFTYLFAISMYSLRPNKLHKVYLFLFSLLCVSKHHFSASVSISSEDIMWPALADFIPSCTCSLNHKLCALYFF